MKNQSKFHSILEAVLMFLALMFTTVGCEKELTKSTQSAKQIKSLHKAAADGDIEQVKLLISKGADVNAGPWTALHTAAYNGRRDIAELLIQKGADVNAKDNKGMTPLHFVLDVDKFKYKLFKDVAKLLIAEGADVSSKDKNGRTPLHLAAESADKDIIELLLAKGAKVDEKDDEYGFTALHYAARFGNKNVAEYLIAKGADINAKDKDGHTPLYLAVHHDYKVAELLVNKGADVNIKTESGQTLFQLTQERKSIESVVPDMIFDGEPNSMFGCRFACGDVDGDGYDDVVIGARKYNNNQGRAYLFYGGPDIDTTCDLIFEGESEGDGFGWNVSCGDIDNDGYDDIVIGAPCYKNQRGRAYLYWGSKRDSMNANPDKIFDGEAEEGGFSISFPGPVIYDIDNDGYRDIIISAVWYPGDLTGRAYLYYGNTKELMDNSYDLIFTAENPGDSFGSSIGCGDVDNDGYGDIIIGARRYPGVKPYLGRIYLYYGDKRNNMDAKADKIFDAESRDQNLFGQDIVCHDVNNDGHYDMVIGAQKYNVNHGRAYLFYGNTRANLDAVADKIFDGEMEYSDYGFAIIFGDIDGDNTSDIIIGADHIRQQTGRVYLYWGSKDMDVDADTTFTGEPSSAFGIPSGGYFNSDEYGDILMGAWAYSDLRGRAYIYYGNTKAKIDDATDVTFTNDSRMSGFGSRRTIGDTNGDGYDDAIINGWCYNNGQGRIWLWYGPFNTSTDITFNWDTTNTSIGKHILKASIAPVAGEEDVADNTMTIMVDVKEPAK